MRYCHHHLNNHHPRIQAFGSNKLPSSLHIEYGSVPLDKSGLACLVLDQSANSEPYFPSYFAEGNFSVVKVPPKFEAPMWICI